MDEFPDPSTEIGRFTIENIRRTYKQREVIVKMSINANEILKVNVIIENKNETFELPIDFTGYDQRKEFIKIQFDQFIQSKIEF